MSADRPLVSVVVVTLNRKDLLGSCLESLSAQDYPNTEIIVVDNGSTEDISGFVSGSFPDVRYLRLPENLGFAGGNNRGIDIATGSYIALLNNDAVADPGWLTAMVDLAERDRALGAVASLIVDGNRPSVLDSCGVGIALDGMSRQAMRGAPVPEPAEPMEVLAVSGCACMFRAEALEEIGLFDEDFFAYCEDTDLSLRLRKAGWRIAVAPAGRITHYYSGTSGAFSLKKVFWVERNHFWVAMKNFPAWLLLFLPFFTFWRWIVQAYALVRGGAEISEFVSYSGPWRVFAAIARAHLAALWTSPRLLLRRLTSRAPSRIGAIEMSALLLRFRLTMRQIITVDTGDRAPRGHDVMAVLPYYFPETTGHCQSFNSLMVFLGGRGLRTAVLTSDRLYAEDAGKLPTFSEYNGVDIHRMSMPAVTRQSPGSHFRYGMLFCCKAVARICTMRTKVVMCITSPPFLYYLLGLVCRVRRIPLILWAMDLYPETLVETGLMKRNGILHRMTRRIAKLGYARCAYIFTLGPVMSRRITDMGIDPELVKCIHNWVPEELEFVAPRENTFISEHGLADKFVIQYSGNIGVVHSFGMLLEAARRLRDEAGDVVIQMIGRGAGKADIEKRVKDEGLKNVMVMDYVAFDRLSHSLSAASVSFVSLKEGLEGVLAPGKIYASLRVGTPVVLVQDAESDLSRIFDDGIEGAVLGTDDCEGFLRYIRELRADPERLRNAREKNAGWYREHCSPEIIGPEFLVQVRRALQVADGSSAAARGSA